MADMTLDNSGSFLTSPAMPAAVPVSYLCLYSSDLGPITVVRAETRVPLRLRMAASSQSTARRPVAMLERVCVVDIVSFCNVRVALSPIYGYYPRGS